MQEPKNVVFLTVWRPSTNCVNMQLPCVNNSKGDILTTLTGNVRKCTFIVRIERTSWEGKMETTGWIPLSLFERGAWIFGRKPAALYFLCPWEGQGPLEVKYSQNGHEIWSLLLSLIKNRRACCTRGTCNEKFAHHQEMAASNSFTVFNLSTTTGN